MTNNKLASYSVLLSLISTSAFAEPYVSLSLGWTFNQKLSGVKGDENLNYPNNIDTSGNAGLFYPGSSYSNINLKDVLTGGLKAGYYFESFPSFGLELEANYSQPNMRRQNVTITNKTPQNSVLLNGQVLIGDAIAADISFNSTTPGAGTLSGDSTQVTEDQLPAKVKLLQFNFNAMYRYKGFKDFIPYIGAGPSLNVIRITGTGESGHFINPTDPEGFEVVSASAAQNVHDTSVNIGANFKVGAEYKIDEQWGLGAEYHYTWVPVDVSHFRSASNLKADLEMQSLQVVLTRHF